MKHIITLISFLAVAFYSSAQWEINYETAKSKALDTDKVLMVFFSGSDWCKPCIKLKKEILTTDEFTAFADANLVVYNADFPYRSKQDKALVTTNEALAEKYNPKGTFPKIVFIKNGKVVYSCGYKKASVATYISDITPNIIN